MSYYITNGNSIVAYPSDLYAAVSYISSHHDDNLKILEDLHMVNLISKIAYVDGVCIYNNFDFWVKPENAQAVFDTFESHEVLDFCNQPVDKDRFGKELWNNRARLAVIDGRAGQISYNRDIGDEFVSIFREECIMTDFNRDSGVTPMIILQKLANVSMAISMGAFREAIQMLMLIQATDTDAFLTAARIQKYIDMLSAADIIEYATDEEYFYHTGDESDSAES